MKKEINRTLGNSLRCILPSFWWKRLLGKMVDKIESAESSASSAMKMAILAGREASDKQSKLVSGSNIKTINGKNILGSGDLKIETQGAIVSRELYAVGLQYGQTGGLISELTQEMKDYNKVTKQLFLEGNADVRIVYQRDGLTETFPIWHYYNYYESFYFAEPFDHVANHTRLQIAIHCVRVEDDGTSTWERYYMAPDGEVLADSYNAVSGKAVKAYVDTEVSKKVDDSIIASIEQQIANKQDNLVSGTSIKTINGNSILGSGDIKVVVDTSNLATKSEVNNKVDKVIGKQLSTEDFTSALKTKLEGLNNYDDASIQNAVNSLTTQINTLVGGDASVAIENFNEIISFLNGIEDSESLDSIIANIEQQIANKQNIIADLTDIRNGAALGTTSLQEHQDISHLATKEAVTNLTNDVLDNEEIYAAAVNDLNIRVVNTDSVLSTEISNRESLQTEFQTFKTQVTENEDVWATSLTDINNRLNTNYQHGEDTYATKNSLSAEIQTINTVIVDNEEVIAATLTDLNSQITSLKMMISELTTRIETLENA